MILAIDLSSTVGCAVPGAPLLHMVPPQGLCTPAACGPASAFRAPDMHFLCILLFITPAGLSALPEQGERERASWFVSFTVVSCADRVPGMQETLTNAW